MGKNHTAVMYTLTCSETCVKNCGKRFHVHVTTKDFMGDIVKVIGPKYDPPQALKEKVLSLIQTWSDVFKGQPDLKEVEKCYNDLKIARWTLNINQSINQFKSKRNRIPND